MRNGICLQAHRGVNAECPENTMAAFRAAVAQGYEVIELDPHYTKDGRIVILHDDRINRTGRNSDGTEIAEPICISDITYAEALQYDFGQYFSIKYKGERIPLLSDALALAKANGVTVKIDNKIERFPAWASEKLYAILAEYEDIIAPTTMHEDVLRFYAEKFPKAQLHYDGPVTEEVMARLSVYAGRLTVWLPYPSKMTSWVRVPFVTDELCRLVKKTAKLGLWIIDDPAVFAEAAERYHPDLVETKGRVKPERAQAVVCDMHSHSQSSHDSQCPVRDMAESAIRHGLDMFAVTDHCDIQYYVRGDMPGVMASSYLEATETARQFAGRVKIIPGIELGEGLWNEDYSREILAAHPWDVVLGSVHAVRYEGMTDPYSRIDFSTVPMDVLKKYVSTYFDDVMDMLHRLPIDVMTHLTCPFSYINGKYNRGLDTRDYRDQIIPILQYVIDHGIAMEVNTHKVASSWGQYQPDEWIIREFKAMGGYLITVGSDAHVQECSADCFPQTLKLLQDIGFDCCWYFENRIAMPCK